MSKPPKQTHLEYLLTTIAGEPDDSVKQLAPIFTKIREELASGTITEQQARSTMEQHKADVLSVITRSVHRTDKLLSATIDYVIDPERKISVG